MLFKRLLTPRAKARPLPSDQGALTLIARGDEDGARRLEACRRLSRLPELRELALGNPDPAVREIARNRYLALLCGLDPASPSIAERLAEFGAADDQAIIEQVASNAGDPEIRKAAFSRLDNPAYLASCALQDPLSSNRCAAAELLADRESLEQVAKQIGKRDKNVYRIVRRKLKAMAEREALPARVGAQCAELCERAERLGRFGHWVQDRAILDLLDRQWAEIDPDADPDWRARYQGLRERFLIGYGNDRREHEAEIAAEEHDHALRDEHRALLEALDACAGLDEESSLADCLERVADRWDALDKLPPHVQAPLDQGYFDRLAAAARVRDELVRTGRRNARLSSLVESGEKALSQSTPLELTRIRSLIEDASGLLEAPGAEQALADAFARIQGRLEARMAKQRSHAEQRLAELPELLDRLAAALDAGGLSRAEPLYQSARAGLDLARSSGLPRKDCNRAEERLRELAPRLHELQQWRRWGSDRQREALCLAMEELGRASTDEETLAARLHDLQLAWKDLDKRGPRAGRPMSERFHTLCEPIFERCRPHLEALAAQREANRRQREDLCRQLEGFLDQVNWGRVDWKKAYKAEREMRQSWVACGEVEARHRGPLERRFHKAIERLDQQLNEERDRNQQHKLDLISRVEALIEQPDLDRAIEETKRLQQEWHTTVPARRTDEDKLWRRFRAACDALFARRRERSDAQRAELEQHLRLRHAICDQAEQLATAEAGPEEIVLELRELELRWRETEALPVPRQEAGKLAQRWWDLHARVLDHRRERLNARRQEDMALLARQARLCERLEMASEGQSDPSADTQALLAQWEALPRQRDQELQRAIEQRFQTAAALAHGESASDKVARRLAANLARRAEICLQLEILAQVESPPEATRERLALQVSRLQEHMRDGVKDPLEGASSLIREWYLCGSPPGSEAAALEARFERASAALAAGPREAEPA